MIVKTSSAERKLLVLVALLLGIIAGLLAGILVAARDAETVSAVLTGGAAFLAVVPLVIGIEHALGLLGPTSGDG
jgi:ABC-type dipeptide/oligopeptide/nickel transport system permease component